MPFWEPPNIESLGGYVAISITNQLLRNGQRGCVYRNNVDLKEAPRELQCSLIGLAMAVGSELKSG
jgi:hypothetical protein